jgi:hypothetical protein
MSDRSNRVDVRNPIVALPGLAGLRAMPPHTREAVAVLLLDISSDARARAEKCWRTHKAPMAAYWKAVAVYAGHIARAVRK